jgi:hypothetical protein
MTQVIDFRFELLFLFCVASSLILLLAAFVLKLRGRRTATKRLFLGLGICWIAYLSTVVLVAATAPQRVIPRNQDLCSDEMCFAVVNLRTVSQIGNARANGIFYIVTMRVSNHGRGRAQSEQGLFARLWSPSQEYRESPGGQSAWDAAHTQNVSLTTHVQPGQSVLSEQVFDVPIGASDPGLVLSNGFTPGYFVIGECPLFHKPTIMLLNQ